MGSNNSGGRQQPVTFAFAPPAHDPPPPPPLSAASDAADWPPPQQQQQRQEYDEKMYLPSASEDGAARWGELPPPGLEAPEQRLAWSEPSEQQQQPQFGQFVAGRQPSYLSHSLHDWAQEQQAAPAPPPPRMAATMSAIQQPNAPSSRAGAGPLVGARQPDDAASRSSNSRTSSMGHDAGPFVGARKLVSLWQTTNQALGGVHR